jgi:hypothetical protein
MAHHSATLQLCNRVEHNKEVQVGVRAVLSASNGPKQDHFHRIAGGHNLVHDRRQCLTQRKAVITTLAIDTVNHGHIRQVRDRTRGWGHGGSIRQRPV